MNLRKVIFAMISLLLIFTFISNSNAQDDPEVQNYYIAQFEIEVANEEDAENLENRIDALAGVVEADIERDKDLFTVRFDKNLIVPKSIIAEMESLGFEAEFLESVKNEPLYYDEDEEQEKN